VQHALKSRQVASLV